MLGHMIKCPSMGHNELSYLDVIAWYDGFTIEDRIERGPFQSAFAVGHGDVAAAAVERARREHVIATAVFDQVKEQAVYALLSERSSIRAIAEKVGIPKSEVGRIARSLGRDGDRPGSRPTMPPMSTRDEVRDRIRTVWGHR